MAETDAKFDIRVAIAPRKSDWRCLEDETGQSASSHGREADVVLLFVPPPSILGDFHFVSFSAGQLEVLIKYEGESITVFVRWLWQVSGFAANRALTACRVVISPLAVPRALARHPWNLRALFSKITNPAAKQFAERTKFSPALICCRKRRFSCSEWSRNLFRNKLDQRNINCTMDFGSPHPQNSNLDLAMVPIALPLSPAVF